MVDFDDGVDEESLGKKGGTDKDEIAKQYQEIEQQKKQKYWHLFLYMFFGILGIAAFYGLFFLLWNEIQSWFGG